jgi:hypothetical protein
LGAAHATLWLIVQHTQQILLLLLLFQVWHRLPGQLRA